MSVELIRKALAQGAKVIGSVSGGKDGQAMLQSLKAHHFPVSALVHADLGSVEWPESIVHCRWLSDYFSIPLTVVRRKDNLGLLEYWQRRMEQVQGKGIPFWSSSQHRYCTSDLKRDPINVFFTATGHDFIISAEGIRADESKSREKKLPLSIRARKSSSYYKGMTVAEAISRYVPGKKLCLTWYPIFNYSLSEVWSSFGMDSNRLTQARQFYGRHQRVPVWWPFHPAYAYGNSRVSCQYCILGSLKDLRTAASHDRAGLLDKMIQMEKTSGFTFKENWSLTALKKDNDRYHQVGLFPQS